MNRRAFFIRMGGAALAVPVALKLGACSEVSVPAEPDATVNQPDAPINEPDAATSEPDAAINEPDAATSEPDAATSEPDAATSEPDAAINEPDAAQAVCVNGTNVTIGSNHGHALVVSTEDVQAGVEKTYDITGISAHPHTVVLTVAHFDMLAAGGTITVLSSTDAAHAHQVIVVCA